MPPSKIGHTASGRTNRCQYRLPENDNYKCPHATLSKAYRLCIFHIPKPSITDEGYEERKAANKKVTDEFAESLNEWISHHVTGAAEFIDLRGFQFPEFRFNPVSLPKKADFQYAVFNDDIEFNVELPKSHPENKYDTHESTLLREGATFDNAIFKGTVSYSGCVIDGEFSFKSTVFDDDASFANITVDTCDFSNSIFKKNADFSFSNIGYGMLHRIQFRGITDFSNIIVQERIGFDSSEFFQPVEFFRCHFGADPEEQDGTKQEGTSEKDEPFLEANRARLTETSFNWTVFHERVGFYETFFNSLADFGGATFRKRAFFYGSRGNLFSEGASFSNVTLPKDEELIFEGVDLSKTRFHDTYLDKVVFRDVLWGRVKGRIRRFFRGHSYVLWDEIRPLDGMLDYLDDNKTADNYRQLVINYESKRDYETAEAFHVSEMEMRRKGVGYYGNLQYEESSEFWTFLFIRLKLYKVSHIWYTLRKYLNGYGLYWLSSRYGTSYRHACVVLTILLVLFSFLFLYTGLRASPDSKLESGKVIEYNIIPDETHPPASPTKFLDDWRESFFFTLELATFQKDKYYQPYSWHGRAISYLGVILLASQAALLLLSIRRRFRRE